MADEHKKSESHKPSDKKHEEHKGEHKPAAKTEHKPADAHKGEHKPAAKADHKPADTHKTEHKGEHKPMAKAEHKPVGKSDKATGAEKKAAQAEKRAGGKSGPSTTTQTSTKGGKADVVKIVEKAPQKKYEANPKPQLTDSQRKALQVRAVIDARRPRFRRQQWYEYKRLSKSGWRKPTGIDSAMRRHFGYEQSVVRVGFGGPREARGLHPSGFREVFIDQIEQLQKIDTKTQAARVSGNLGARKLRHIYVEADKLGVHVLNRRELPPAPKAANTKSASPKGGKTQ